MIYNKQACYGKIDRKLVGKYFTRLYAKDKHNIVFSGKKRAFFYGSIGMGKELRRRRGHGQEKNGGSPGQTGAGLLPDGY